MKCTPGPWKVLAGDWDKKLNGYCRYTIAPAKILNMADVNVIENATEMLEILKLVKEEMHIINTGLSDRTIQRVVAVIGKVESGATPEKVPHVARLGES